MKTKIALKVKKRRFVTLIEMMIVMFLIALIMGVIAYNYQGSLEKGKAFKTEVAIEKIKTILTLYLAENPDARDNISTEWETIIKKSPLVQDKNSLLKDGWGQPYQVRIADDGTLEVISERYEASSAKKSP